jgi:N-acetylglucosamine-6-phosphate deacetylase
MMAITDGTGGSGLPVGAEAALGGRRITVRDTAAFLDDGTLAGSVLTMDRAFRNLVERVGLSLVDAARMCATTPARELRLAGQGAIEPGAFADLVVLDGHLRVAQTWVGGELAFSR